MGGAWAYCQVGPIFKGLQYILRSDTQPYYIIYIMHIVCLSRMALLLLCRHVYKYSTGVRAEKSDVSDCFCVEDEKGHKICTPENCDKSI